MELFSSWTGSDFLLFYAGLLGAACLAAWWIPANLRASGRQGPLDDLECIAVVSGGPARMTDSLLTDLYVRGALTEGDKGRLVICDSKLASTPAGKALLEVDAPLTLDLARRTLAIHAERVTARLQRAGLLQRPEECMRLRWLSVTPFAALLMLGLYRQRAGDAVGEPTGFLVILMGLILIFAIIRFFKYDPRTMAGIDAVRRQKEQASRFARAPLPDEAAMAVALLGTGVLVGTPWQPVHAMRQQSGDGGGADGGGGSSSDGDGGSGCGGGCGGCGG